MSSWICSWSNNKNKAIEQVCQYVSSVKELASAEANQDAQSKNKACKIVLKLFKLPYKNPNPKSLFCSRMYFTYEVCYIPKNHQIRVHMLTRQAE